MNWADIIDPLWKLGLAIALSAVVGVERLLADKPAGLRTHILVGFGSALFMVAAELGGLDVDRVAAGLITGIGFLGAGTIFREQKTVQGLTTAASIWAVAGIGIACARGLWLLALAGTVGIVIILWVLGIAEDKLERVLNKFRKRDRK